MPSFQLNDNFRDVRIAIRTHESDARNPDISWWCATSVTNQLRLPFKRESQIQWLSRDQLFGWIPSGHPFRKATASVVDVVTSLESSIDATLTDRAASRIKGDRIAFELNENPARLGVLSSDKSLARFDITNIHWICAGDAETVIVGTDTNLELRILEVPMDHSTARQLFTLSTDSQLLFASRDMALTCSLSDDDRYTVTRHYANGETSLLPLDIPVMYPFSVSDCGLYICCFIHSDRGEPCIAVWSVTDGSFIFQDTFADAFQESQPVRPVWSQTKLWYVTRDYDVSNIYTFDVKQRRLISLGQCNAFISSLSPFQETMA